MTNSRRARAKEEPGFLLRFSLLRERVSSFEAYPFSISAVSALAENPVELHPHVTYVIGENGAGKSTILEAIAVAAGFNAEGGTKNFQFATRRSESELSHALRLVRSYRRPRTGFFLRAESFFNVATTVEQLGPEIAAAYGGRSLHEQSHGESFISLAMHRFGREGLYVLDEPEAALSPVRQMSMLRRMHDLVRDGSQFLIATHAPILLAYPGAIIYEIGEAGWRRVPYEETETVRVTKDFLDRREALLAELFADG
jgi:predicted ATPase